MALVLLAIFAWLGARAALAERPSFFESFYTVLVLADVLLVFLSLRYSSAYHVVFAAEAQAAAAGDPSSPAT